MSNDMDDILNLPGVINDDERHVIQHLARYGHARNRTTDREPRTLTITDDQAVMLLAVITRFYGGPDQPVGS